MVLHKNVLIELPAVVVVVMVVVGRRGAGGGSFLWVCVCVSYENMILVTSLVIVRYCILFHLLYVQFSSAQPPQ